MVSTYPLQHGRKQRFTRKSRYNCRFQLSSTSELHSSGQATTSQPETQLWSHLFPSFRRYPMCCAATPAIPRPTVFATTAALAMSTRLIVSTAPTAPTAAPAPRLCAQRPATIHPTVYAKTAAPARSTRLCVSTAPTAPTAAPAPREARRPLPLPLPPGRRRPAPMLGLVVHQHAQEIMIHILDSSSAQLSMGHTSSIFKSHFLCLGL